MLATLLDAGFVEREPGGQRWQLGLRLVHLGNAALARLDLRDLARPLLEQLVRETGETATLSLQAQGEGVTVDFVPSPHSVSSRAEIGRASVAHATAVGKVVLAYTPGALAALAEPLERYTPRTLTTLAELELAVAGVRTAGIAEGAGEREPGLNAIAAPVLADDGRLVAVLGLQGPERFDGPQARRRCRPPPARRDAASRSATCCAGARAGLRRAERAARRELMSSCRASAAWLQPCSTSAIAMPSSRSSAAGLGRHRRQIDGDDGFGRPRYIDTAVAIDHLIYDIADFGIQAYPDSQNTVIEANVIDGTGMGGVTIGSEGGTPSSGNTVRRNIIVNSKGAPVATYWGGSAGSGNSAVDNCVSNTLAQGSYAGLTVSGTKVVASSGLDASYRLAAGAACAGYGPAASQRGGSGGVSPPPPPPPPPPAAAGGSEAPGSPEGRACEARERSRLDAGDRRPGAPSRARRCRPRSRARRS